MRTKIPGRKLPGDPDWAQKFGKPQRELFLMQLRRSGIVSQALSGVGVTSSTVYRLRASDSAFSEAWDDAIEAATDTLETEARRRAVDGWDEPIYQGGELVGYRKKYSDNLLAMLLRGRRAIYRDRVDASIQHSGGVGVQLIIQTIGVDPNGEPGKIIEGESKSIEEESKSIEPKSIEGEPKSIEQERDSYSDEQSEIDWLLS